ncbi:MAG: hypothetical protein KDB32_09515 [Planctomycetes bacterium]|nr:hypothetical protein [Planctomycetota bacterium]
MARSAKSERKSGTSLRTRKGKASMVFAGLVALLLLTGGAYLQITDQWNVVTAAASLKYEEWVKGVVNHPDNEAMRADLIAHVVEHYRETPAKKSLPLRDDEGHVIGRFRINVADVAQPFATSEDPAQRRIYTVDLSGQGELWHETGGRVRFHGSALVTYVVDFEIDDWAAYAHFQCTDVEHPQFECDHIDNILGKIFSGAVRSAGTKALDESLRPGFTVIAKTNGDTWLAAGKVGREFVPRKGPYPETDADEGFETITNDVSLLHPGFRDYLGPIELFDDAELRITMEAESLEPPKTVGIDVYVLTEEQYEQFEHFYPGDMDRLAKLDSIEFRHDMQKLNMTTTGLSGNVYILLDYTGWGSGKDPEDRAEAGLVKYYVRAKR